jgi:hypothetical protein
MLFNRYGQMTMKYANTLYGRRVEFKDEKGPTLKIQQGKVFNVRPGLYGPLLEICWNEPYGNEGATIGRTRMVKADKAIRVLD